MGTRVRGPPGKSAWSAQRRQKTSASNVRRASANAKAAARRGGEGSAPRSSRRGGRILPPRPRRTGRSDAARSARGHVDGAREAPGDLLGAAVHGPAGPDGLAQAARLVAAAPATGTLLEVGEEMGGVDELELVVVVRLDEEAGRPAIHRLGRITASSEERYRRLRYSASWTVFGAERALAGPRRLALPEVVAPPAVLEEGGLEEPPAAVEARHDRPERDLEDVGHLAVREVLQVDELDDEPEVLRKRRERRRDGRVHRRGDELVLRARVRGGARARPRRLERLVAVGAEVDFLRADLRVPVAVDERVLEDAEEPRLEVRALVKPS